MEQSSSNPKRITNAPRIYVASLADYVAGRLHGRRIDADQPIEVIREEIAEMLAESTEPIAEEWAIRDYEAFAGLPFDGQILRLRLRACPEYGRGMTESTTRTGSSEFV